MPLKQDPMYASGVGVRLAVVRSSSGSDARENMSSLLGRPVEDLAADLVRLGHQVTLLDVRRPVAPGTRAEGPSFEAHDRIARDRLVAGEPHAVRVVRCSSGRDLAATLDAADVDVALAVDRGSAEQLERASPDLALSWVWAPMPDDLRSSSGQASRWVPRHASRFVLGSRPDIDLLERAGVGREKCDVVSWQLSMPARALRLVVDVAERATEVLTSSGGGSAGVADVIRAVAVLPEMRLTVAVDEASLADRHTISRWVRLASGLRAADRVRFVQVRSGAAVRALVRSADLVVSVPRGRPELSLIAAAMWAGTPVVVSDVDGVRELVDSGTGGLVLPSGPPRRLARVLRVVGQDVPARSTWAAAAQRKAQEGLDSERAAVEMSIALQAACSTARSVGTVSLAGGQLHGVGAVLATDPRPSRPAAQRGASLMPRLGRTLL